MVDAFVLVAALASSRVTLQHEVWLEGDAPLTLGDLAKLEGEACRYHALEVPQGQPDDPIDLAFVIDLLDHCAAPVFRWEFRGSVATIERTSLPSIEEPTPIAAPTPGPQSLRAIIGKRLRLAPNQLRVRSLDGTELPEGEWTLRTHPTVRTVRARLGETDHAFTLEIADEDGQWHPNWQFNPRSQLNRATAPDLIKRGNQVSVERRLGGFLARTNGRVMGSAKAGEQVQVRLDDGVIRHGTLRKDGVVELMEGSS